jgi:hypothetical protein
MQETKQHCIKIAKRRRQDRPLSNGQAQRITSATREKPKESRVVEPDSDQEWRREDFCHLDHSKIEKRSVSLDHFPMHMGPFSKREEKKPLAISMPINNRSS